MEHTDRNVEGQTALSRLRSGSLKMIMANLNSIKYVPGSGHGFRIFWSKSSETRGLLFALKLKISLSWLVEYFENRECDLKC
jgi:hypothetical protein